MSYVQPNSRVEFFDDLGLSQDYNDTLYFVSAAAKDSYFDNINRLAHADKCYYVRENRGRVRVELPLVTMIHAQYMRFKNTSYENRWFYAFVKDVIYINDNTVEVTFELDIIMTWMGYFTLTDCFVERQHSSVDYIGANTVPESINLSMAPVIRNRFNTQTCGKYYPVIFMSHKTPAWIEPGPDLKLYQPQTVGGVYNALDMIYCGTPAAVEFVISTLITQNWIDDVVAIKMLPEAFIPLDESVGENRLVTRSYDKPYTDISGYVPKNKKLFTYPYNYLSVSNTEGEENTFRYEWFGDLPPDENDYQTYSFDIIGSWNIDCQLMCFPHEYLNILRSYEKRLTMQDFPTCAWNVDLYKAMMAQKESSLPTRLLASAMNTAATNAARPVAQPINRGIMATEGISAVTDIIANKVLPPEMPTVVRGSQGSNTLIGQKVYDPEDPTDQTGTEKDFIFTEMNAAYEDARIIDGYFTMFGYQQNRVMTPNMNARPHYTYIKTVDCKIDCRCPASDANFIESIFNKGIRFWKNHTEIGHYNDPLVDNTPV